MMIGSTLINPCSVGSMLNARKQIIAAALNGDYRSEHIFVLQQELQLYDVYQTQIVTCHRQIQECLAQSDKVNLNESPLPQSKHPRNKPQGNVLLLEMVSS
ncbi:MAG: hypothetical protein KME50_12850 [Nostoc desertorum CM1-VF14]|jgi:hypothetical protein|nr:hypothetical protein [Nostoc desertorum CM1-VF14]